MKKLICLAIVLLMIFGCFLSACNSDITNSGESSAESSVVQSSEPSNNSSAVTSNGEESSEIEIEPFVYEGEVEIILISGDDASMVARHNIEQITDFEKIFAILNDCEWEYLAEEYDESLLTYGCVLCIGDSVIYYDEITGDFVDKARSAKINAGQYKIPTTKNMVNEIFAKIFNSIDTSEETEALYQKSIMGTPFKNDATGYESFFEISDSLKAVGFETHNELEITAVYDGEITRFYNSNNGEYITEAKGEYLTVCCDAGFCVGEYSEGFCRAVLFEKEKYSDELTFEFITDSSHRHGGHHPTPTHWIDFNYYFSDYDNRVFLPVVDEYAENGEGNLRYFNENDYRICRKITIDSPFPDTWESETQLPEIKSESKFGVVYKGEAIIPFEYDIIDYYSTDDCRFGVFRGVKDGKTYYISTNGDVLTPNGFVCGSQPCNNKALVYDGTNVKMIEFTGDESLNYNGEIEAVDKNGEKIQLNQEEKDAVLQIVNGEKFNSGYTDCPVDFVIYIGGNGLRYCTECGTLIGNEVYLQLSDENVTALNEILID